MKAEFLLDIPDQVAGKLATGELERVGGSSVIQKPEKSLCGCEKPAHPP